MVSKHLLAQMIEGLKRIGPAIWQIRKNQSLAIVQRELWGSIPWLSLTVIVALTLAIWVYTTQSGLARPPFEASPFNFVVIPGTFVSFPGVVFGVIYGIRMRSLMRPHKLSKITADYHILRPVYDGLVLPLFILGTVIGLLLTAYHGVLEWQSLGDRKPLEAYALLPLQMLANTSFHALATTVVGLLVLQGKTTSAGVTSTFGPFYAPYVTLFVLKFIPFVGDDLAQLLDFQLVAETWRDGLYGLVQLIVFSGVLLAVLVKTEARFESTCSAAQGSQL
jgi:hypothetical protein